MLRGKALWVILTVFWFGIGIAQFVEGHSWNGVIALTAAQVAILCGEREGS